MPPILRRWLELVEPHKPEVEYWEQLDTLEEPQYVKVLLKDGQKIIVKQEGTWIKTWRYAK